MTVTLVLNGRRRRVKAPPMARLLDVLREEFGLTGTKEGCGEGECGACTVLIDGTAVDACLVPVAHADGASVTTIEGASRTRAGRRLQEAFVVYGGAQCGICTPGMIMAALPVPAGASAADVTTALAGNLCRCTGYHSIVRAVTRAKSPSTPRAASPRSRHDTAKHRRRTARGRAR